MSIPSADRSLPELIDPALARPLPAALIRVRADVRAAARDPLAIPGRAVEVADIAFERTVAFLRKHSQTGRGATVR